MVVAFVLSVAGCGEMLLLEEVGSRVPSVNGDDSEKDSGIAQLNLPSGVDTEFYANRLGLQYYGETNSQEWRENRKTRQAAFYPFWDGWSAYEPAGFPGTQVIQYPGREKVAEAFVRAEKDFISQEITTEVALLQSKIDASQGSPRSTNKLGVLYARYRAGPLLLQWG